MDKLPTEVLFQFYDDLSFRELISLSSVSKIHHAIATATLLGKVCSVGLNVYSIIIYLIVLVM